MSKITPLARIDRDYQKNIKFPDINDFLKDTSYAESTSALPDNQTYVNLRCAVSNDSDIEIMSNLFVHYYSMLLYMAPMEFYGYNPELESAERIDISIEFLDVEVPRVQSFYRGNGDDRLITLPGQQLSDGNGDLYNYKLRLSVNTVEKMLNWIFSTQAIPAFFYFMSEEYNDYWAGKYYKWVLENFYTLTIPLTARLYYFGATDHVATYNTYLTFGSIVTKLNSSLVVKSSIIYPTVYAGIDSIEKAKYLAVSANFAGPVSSSSASLIATISGTSYTSAESLELHNGKINQPTSLLRDKVGRVAHSSYSITYPTVSFSYNNGSSVVFGYNENVSLSSYQPSVFAPKVNPIQILDYFIGHSHGFLSNTAPLREAYQSGFEIMIEFTAPINTIIENQEKSFILEFMEPDSKTERNDSTGQVSSTVKKNKLVFRGMINDERYELSSGGNEDSSQTASTAIAESGMLYRSSYFYERYNIYNSVVQKIFNELPNSNYSAPVLSRFRAYVNDEGSVDSTTKRYVLRVIMSSPNVNEPRAPEQYLLLVAELPIIRLSLGNFLFEINAQGTYAKKVMDNYTREKNPFYDYPNRVYSTNWKPRITSLLVNDVALTGSTTDKFPLTLIGPNTGWNTVVPNTTVFYKLSVSPASAGLSGLIKMTFKIRLFADAASENPWFMLAACPVLNRDAKGFMEPVVKLFLSSVRLFNVRSSPSSMYTQYSPSSNYSGGIGFLNPSKNKSPRSYFLTNLKSVGKGDEQYYTFSEFTSNGLVRHCDVGFYYDGPFQKF